MMSCSMFACVQQLPEGTGVSKDAKVAFGVAARIFVSYCTATYVLPPTLFCLSALFSISTCGGPTRPWLFSYMQGSRLKLIRHSVYYPLSFCTFPALLFCLVFFLNKIICHAFSFPRPPPTPPCVRTSTAQTKLHWRETGRRCRRRMC